MAPADDAPRGAPAAGTLQGARRAPPNKSGSSAGYLPQDPEQVRRCAAGRRERELVADARGAARVAEENISELQGADNDTIDVDDSDRRVATDSSEEDVEEMEAGGAREARSGAAALVLRFRHPCDISFMSRACGRGRRLFHSIRVA